jgi:hypothetical protein
MFFSIVKVLTVLSCYGCAHFSVHSIWLHFAVQPHGWGKLVDCRPEQSIDDPSEERPAASLARVHEHVGVTDFESQFCHSVPEAGLTVCRLQVEGP